MNNSDIEQLTDLFNTHHIQYWLIGGRAIDLILGFVSRPHKDIDFFVNTTHFDTCVTVLQDVEFTILPNTLREDSVFLQRDDILVGITKILVSVDYQTSRLKQLRAQVRQNAIQAAKEKAEIYYQAAVLF